MSTETTHIETEKQLVPALRFRGFDSEWKKSTLKKEAIVNPRTNELPEKFIYIDLESVKKGMLVKEEEICLSEAPSRAQRLLDKDDILYQTVRPYQKNNLYFDRIGDYVASTGYAQIKAKGDSKYLFQFLHTTPFVNVVNRWSTGTSYPAINPSELVKIQVAFPTLPEQQKIASFLAAVDEKTQQLTKKKALLEDYKKGVMQQLFSCQLRFKDENGEAYPDWEEKRLGEVATFLKGKGISKADLSNEGVLECIRYGELYTVYGETIIEVFSRTNVSEKELILSVKDDVIIPASGETQIDIATASCVRKSNVALGGDLNIIRSANDGVFLAYYLNSALKFDIARLSQGVSVVHLYSSQLKTLKIGVPKIEEQQKIATYLSRIDTKIESVNNQITQTQTFKKGLLQRMFV
jgi:type I restriction enzyme S subunit